MDEVKVFRMESDYRTIIIIIIVMMTNYYYRRTLHLEAAPAPSGSSSDSLFSCLQETLIQ